MIITTLFAREASFARGEVEVKLMPGIPHLHVVGLPDRSIRECGIRLKSALKSSGFKWPRGHQIVVNLRPSYLRKESAGIDLAVALGVLRATNQLRPEVADRLGEVVVYGELALDGRVFAPVDVDRALAAVGPAKLLTGDVGEALREGRWLELANLAATSLTPRAREFNYAASLTPPPLADLNFAAPAFEALCLAAYLNLNVLVAGPQGSGKSTWARALYALSPPPDQVRSFERAALFGQQTLLESWRPLEQPHHTSPALAMIGGGRPLRPGVISRAHGGVLIMDEFLEFDPKVLEALREPIETGAVELARLGVRDRFPADFQLIATSNLCPCGELNPVERVACRFNPTTCKRTCARLSGPVLDRFDLLVPSHEWLGAGDGIPLRMAPPIIAAARAFAAQRKSHATRVLGEERIQNLSHRRRRALAKVARGLADFDDSDDVTSAHVQRAHQLVIGPMESLRRVFG